MPQDGSDQGDNDQIVNNPSSNDQSKYGPRLDKAAAQFSNTRSRIMRPDSSSAVENRP